MIEKTMETTVQLGDGVKMPLFGLGLFSSAPGDETYNAARYALEAGYKLMDTAAYYANEESLGKAVRDSGAGREKLFITTKMWPVDYSDPKAACMDSLKKLGMDYIDLYLMHWPGTDAERRKKVWNAMLELREKGYVRACGVSNFYSEMIEELISDSGVVPQNHQIELHPWIQQRKMRAYCAEKGITVTSWGPIFHGHLSEAPLMEEIGKKHGKTAAQATLRWHLQQDINLIPKSVKKQRIIENAAIFDFSLDEEDMRRIGELDGMGQAFTFDPLVYDGEGRPPRMDPKQKGLL